MALSLFPQRAGDAGVRQTLNTMATLVNQSFLDPVIRDQAAYAVSGCLRGAKDCQCYSVLSFVTRKVRYVADPRGVEMLHAPRLMARAVKDRQLVYGDCDDMSMYVAALLKSIGLNPMFKATGYNGKPFQHVYVMCEGLKLDATRSAWIAPTLYPMHETSVMEGRI